MPFLKSFFSQISLLGSFWQEKINHHLFRWNLVLIIFQIIILVFKFNSLPTHVPLYYSLPWGENQLGAASSLFLLPTFSIVVLLINNLIATFFLKTIPLFSRLLTVFSLVFSFLSAISLTRIINLIS
ncbi:MAG: hypothetical protein WCY28_00855 [Candidatus Shapirobacteria bacterium]